MTNDRYPMTAASIVMCISGCAPEAITEAEAIAEASCTEANSLCVELRVPADYAGQASRLATAFYDTADVNRLPDALVPEVLSPTVVAGEAYSLSHTELEVSGEYYVMFVLYDVDGGIWSPMEGVDLTAVTEQAAKFDGTPVNFGELSLALAE